jgi:hypothetical protein
LLKRATRVRVDDIRVCFARSIVYSDLSALFILIIVVKVHSNIVLEPITASAETKRQFLFEYISHLRLTEKSVDDCRSSLRLMAQYFQPHEDILQDSQPSKKHRRKSPQARVQKAAAAFQPFLRDRGESRV